MLFAVAVVLLGIGGALLLRGDPGSNLGFGLVVVAVVLAFWVAVAGSKSPASMSPTVDLGLVRSVLDQISDGVAIFDEGNTMIVSNLAAARVVDSHDGVVSRLALFDREGAPIEERESPLGRALSGHHVHEREFFAERLDGSLAPVEVRAEPILDHGRAAAAVVVIRDRAFEERTEAEIQAAVDRAESAEANLTELTRQLRMAEAEVGELRESTALLEADAARQRRRLTQLVESVGAVGVALFSAPDFRLLEANENALVLLGERRRARDVRGSELPDIVPGAESSGLLDLFRQVATSGETFASEEYYAEGLRHGASYWRFSLVPLAQSPGETADQLVLVGLDITEGVAQRATATAAPKAESDWKVEDILLAISNDLRTPILSIQGMVDLFRQKYAEAVPDVTALHYLELTQRNADQMATLIDELKGLSDLGRSEVNRVEIPLAALVEEAWRAAPRTGIELRVAGPLPTVRADRAKLLRGLRDLFEVAARTRRDGPGAWMHIKVKDAGELWEIELSDNGRSLDAEEAETLFGPLARRAAATNGSLTLVGSGIGLAAVRRIAELHGGTASAGSAPAGGSVYTVSIEK
jgi:signal transduction histidine kinase